MYSSADSYYSSLPLLLPLYVLMGKLHSLMLLAFFLWNYATIVYLVLSSTGSVFLLFLSTNFFYGVIIYFVSNYSVR